jgi:beta-phosphoglucomutase-like phosphatase (HAD superfamily)
MIQSIIKALTVDADDTLFMSELLAFAVCCGLINEVLQYFGVESLFTPDQLLNDFRGRSALDMILELALQHQFLRIMRNGADVTAEVLPQFRGHSFKEMSSKLGKDYNYTIPSVTLSDGRVLTLEELVEEEMNRVIAAFGTFLQPTNGVIDALDELSKFFNLHLGSSSPEKRLKASLIGAKLMRFFEPFKENVFSATTLLVLPGLGNGKPSGDIWRLLMQECGLESHQCVGVEDSEGGVRSLKDANIIAIGYIGIYPSEKRAEMTKRLTDAGADGILQEWNFVAFINLVWDILAAKGKFNAA